MIMGVALGLNSTVKVLASFQNVTYTLIALEIMFFVYKRTVYRIQFGDLEVRNIHLVNYTFLQLYVKVVNEAYS